MSANRNLLVNSKRFYFAGPNETIPRAEVCVEGCNFIFSCDRKLQPIRVWEGKKEVHAQIKRTAHAHAAILFKENLTPAEIALTPKDQLKLC